MGIDKTGENHPPGAVDFAETALVFPDPGILEGIGCFPYRDDLAGEAKDSRIGDDSEFLESAATSRAGSRGSTDGEELTDVEEQQSLPFAVLFVGTIH
jgi:hypothetical protein